MSDESFSVLLAYAHFTNEPLVAKHAAAAAGMAERTAYSRISKAKTDFSIILNEDKPAEKSAGSPKTPGIEVFKVLIKYTEAAGTNLNAKSAAKAAGIAERTAYSKIKQAREELQIANGGNREDSAVDGLKRKGEIDEEKVAKKAKKWKKVEAVKIEDGDDRGGNGTAVDPGGNRTIQAFSLPGKVKKVKAVNVFEKGDGDDRGGKEGAADGGEGKASDAADDADAAVQGTVIKEEE